MNAERPSVGCRHPIPTASAPASELSTLVQRESVNHPPGTSGVHLLEHGDAAFHSRLALCRAAERTLDIQYYLWEPDATGVTLMSNVLSAADAGVRVRILLDDVHVRGKDRVIALVDMHPNVEIRLFNPFPDRGGWSFRALTNLERLNHRMHNKVFVADGAAAIVGGRNIADDYFGVNTSANFRDLDLLVAGPVVRKFSRSFDDYWESPWAVPVASLIGRRLGGSGGDRYRWFVARRLGRRRRFPYAETMLPEEALRWLETVFLSLTWDKTEALVDPPAKVGGQEASVIQRRLDSLVASVRRELLIETAYLIPTRAGLDRLRGLLERGVRVRVLTNSLSSNDVLAAHAGYARFRRELLAIGVELYEMRPDAREIARGWRPLAFRSKSALHTKTIVFDRKKVLVGSLNLDPRSLAINTEVALLCHSPGLSASVARFMDAGVRPENAYRVRLADSDMGGGLLWTLDFGTRRRVYRHDPRAGIWKRLGAALIGMLPFEEQL